MIRNDYRRALIMLRGLLAGYGGHARIEVRTLAGTLSALASIPQGERSVYAALVGNHRGKYYAAPLGAFRRDMRGQGVMTVTFDPRDIGGRPLEAYDLLTLVEVAGGKGDIAMVGNMNGSVDVDWGKAREAACALYRTDTAPVSELLSEKAEEEPEEQENIIWDLTPEVQDQTREQLREPQSEQPQELPLAQDQTQDQTREQLREPQPEQLQELPLAQDQTQDQTREQLREPEAEEGLPPMEGEGWSFVKLPILKDCGFACSYIGVRSECTPEVICYALPSRFTSEPPPGLDDYEWLGEGGNGWWVYCQSPADPN